MKKDTEQSIAVLGSIAFLWGASEIYNLDKVMLENTTSFVCMQQSHSPGQKFHMKSAVYVVHLLRSDETVKSDFGSVDMTVNKDGKSIHIEAPDIRGSLSSYWLNGRNYQLNCAIK